jgi:hypothetical protein
LILATVLRERIKKDDLALSASEAMRIIWMLERLSQRCGEAYQVVGSLAGFAEMMDDPAVQKALDLLSFPLRPGEILPFITQKDRERARERHVPLARWLRCRCRWETR